jgi:pSer/pThr/pTyr-binding forkhead associated (FHA) protein
MSFGTIIAPDSKEYTLTQPVTTIGRMSSSDIHLADIFVTRQHAQLICHGEEVFIIDLDSVNGTLVNGEKIEPITPVPLADGDEITVGKTVLVFRTGEKPV